MAVMLEKAKIVAFFYKFSKGTSDVGFQVSPHSAGRSDLNAEGMRWKTALPARDPTARPMRAVRRLE